MANIQESQVFEIEDLVADNRYSKDTAAQGEPGNATAVTDNESPSEDKGLPCKTCCLTKFKNRRYCLCSSKAVVLILVWNIIVGLVWLGF